MRVRVVPVIALGALLVACSTASGSQPSFVGNDCATYGGCDVLVDHTDGTSTLLTLKLINIADATSRALAESQKDGVADAAVVGDAPPHVALSNLYHH